MNIRLCSVGCGVVDEVIEICPAIDVSDLLWRNLGPLKLLSLFGCLFTLILPNRFHESLDYLFFIGFGDLADKVTANSGCQFCFRNRWFHPNVMVSAILFQG